MDVRTISTLSAGMEQALAEEHLMLMDAASYPHLENKTKNKVHKKWYRLAYPESFENKVVKTTDLELF